MSEKLPHRSVTVRKVRNRMIVAYTIMIIILFFAAFTYTSINLQKITNRELSESLTSLELQFVAAMNNFTESVESDCTEAFCREDIITYDPVANSYAEYELTALKSDVKTELLEMSAGKCYTDFMILFSDNSSVGKISSGTSDIISSMKFDGFSGSLGDRSDAWLFGLSGNYHRIYYVRSISDHSIFIVSLYKEELDRIFAVNNGMVDEMLFLTDSDGKVIYSNSKDAVSGMPMPAIYSAFFNGADGECIITDDYTGASIETECGWTVSAVAKTPTFVEISPITATAAFAMTIIIIFFSLSVGIFSCGKYILSEITDPNSEFIDPLTGALNEYGLDEKISELMETSIVGSTYAFILIGIKDAKQIKSTVSARYWNNIRIKLIQTAENYFSGKNFHIGRVSDDQIAVFADYSEFDIFKAHESLKEGCEGFCRALENFTVGSDNDLILHVSVGVCIYPDHAEDFDTLLEKAGEALKKADESEGDSMVVYSPSETKEAIGK